MARIDASRWSWAHAIRWLRENRLFSVTVVALIATGLLLLSTTFFYKYNRYMAPERPAADVLGIGIIGVFAIIAFAVLSSLFALRAKRALLIWAWLGILTMSAIFFSLIFPPGSVPDESYHYLQAYSFANLLQGFPANDHSTNMRMTDYAAFRNFQEVFHVSDYADLKNSIVHLFSDNESRFFYPTHWSSEVGIEELPQTRIPAAIGIIVSQWLHLSGTMTFYMGRFFNFATFAALTFFAVRLTPIARPAFMTLSLIPGVLHFASSYSYDAVIFGLSFLLIALCLKCFYEPQSIRASHLTAILIVMALLAPCKSIYSALVLLILFIPPACFSNKKRSLLYKGFAVAAVIASLALFSFSYIIGVLGLNKYTTTTQAATIDYESARHSLSEFLEHPIRTIFIYLNTIVEQGSFHINSLLGGSLGWFHIQPEIAAPWLFLLPYIVILFISAQCSPKDTRRVSGKQKLLFAVICTVVYLGGLTAMFTASTLYVQWAIQGAQGRYFIPIALLVLLILRLGRLRLDNDPTAPLIMSAFALNLAYLQFIYTRIMYTPV